MAGWMLVDVDRHRIAKAPNGMWGMYCPERGPLNIIYAVEWRWVLVAFRFSGPCPHDALLSVTQDWSHASVITAEA